MPDAYNGKILHVDLTEGRTWVEEPAPVLYRRYLGGSAFASHIMLRDMKPGVDPLSPDNLFIAMTSVINGLPLSGANRYTVAGKNPLTGGFGEAEAGGYWGPELKRAGFDGLVVHGRAQKPVYLFVYDGRCEIRDATKYWGELSGEVQEGLEQELGDRQICVLQTGVAGERLVRYAAVCNQLRHFHGRCGLGAVMGSKNLKAIAVRGHKRLAAVDKERMQSILRWYREELDKPNVRLHVHGTAGGIPNLNADGILPTRNFRDGAFERAYEVSGETMTKTILVNRGTCFACLVQCKREVSVPARGVEPKYGGMEYEVVDALGPNCGVGDLEAIAEASQWVNRYILDGISTGVVIAFAMECYEHGILTKEDTGGLELVWGNADAVIALIHKIARREGIGNVLAEGVKRAAARIGKGAEQFAMHVKGQELPMHDPRGKVGLGLAYAMSPTGADHVEAAHDPSYEQFGDFNHSLAELGLLEPLNRFAYGPAKAKAFFYCQNIWSLYNCIGMCVFVGAPIGDLRLSKLCDFVNAATGWNMTVFELMKVGERANTMARLFNLREGFTAADDVLPDRLFSPMGKGKLSGCTLDRAQFGDMLRMYYQIAGWDENGVPTPGKLADLDLGTCVESRDRGE